MKRTKHTALAFLLTLCFTLGLLPALTVPANAATNVSYLDASGATQTAASATSVTSSSTTWSAGWYVVDSDVAISSRITVTGDVHLILADDKTLNASAGIGVSASDNASLTIYGQAEGTGALSATGGSKYAGIGSGNGTNGGNGAAGIITVNGGAVTANGGSQSAGIGGGPYGAGGNITINGGTVTANGGLYSAGIGGGPYGAGGNITINGGTVNANGNVKGGRSDGGAGIGGGENGNNSGAGNSISITGGTVTATVPTGTKGAAIGNGGGDDGTDASVTIGAGLTVGAGSNKDGSDAQAITDSSTVANNTSYKYVMIPFVATPSYTITAADTTTDTGKKYQYGDEFTIAVTVSGADFEGGEFTLTYDSATLEVKTFPANNKFADSEQTAGSVKFEALNKATITDGNALATITFTVKTKVTTDTTCNFTFEGTPKICYDTGENSVEAATVTPGSVIVEPVTYAVTLTPSPSGFTLTGDNGVDSVDNDKAIDGQPYSVTIGDYNTTDYEYGVALTVGGSEATAPTISDGVITIAGGDITGDFTLTVTRTTKHVTATLEGGLLTGSSDAIKGVDYTATIDGYDAANYTYAVTLTMNGASATAPTPDTTGKLTITGTNITGNFTLSVTRTLANFTVTTTADYVTGWTLVTVAKASGRTDNPVYNYDGNAMYYVEAYSAYAYLVSGAVTVADATAKVTLGTSAAATIAAGYDVNATGKVDYSDALLTYRCYEKAHETPSDAMETYLRADADASKKVDTSDVSAIDSNRTPES